jgi:hypothetical protein
MLLHNSGKKAMLFDENIVKRLLTIKKNKDNIGIGNVPNKEKWNEKKESCYYFSSHAV